jgi:hypothetical protein
MSNLAFAKVLPMLMQQNLPKGRFTTALVRKQYNSFDSLKKAFLNVFTE